MNTYAFVVITGLTGLLAAILAFVANRIVIRLWRRETVFFLGPVIEETCKTGLALLVGVSLVGVHSVFGFIEASWELLTRPANLKAALAAWGVHSLLGLLVHFINSYSGQALLAWTAGCFFHAAWNRLILTLHHR